MLLSVVLAYLILALVLCNILFSYETWKYIIRTIYIYIYKMPLKTLLKNVKHYLKSNTIRASQYF